MLATVHRASRVTNTGILAKRNAATTMSVVVAMGSMYLSIVWFGIAAGTFQEIRKFRLLNFTRRIGQTHFELLIEGRDKANWSFWEYSGLRRRLESNLYHVYRLLRGGFVLPFLYRGDR